MTEEIKQRIEQIRHRIVPEGYKKTVVGVFPSDWNTNKLGELLDFKNGINADKEKFGYGTKLISVRDILSDHPIVYDSIQGAVDVDVHQIKEFGVEYGDVLFQRSSENYEDVGTSNVYLDPQNTAVFSGFVIRGKKKAKYNPVYFNSLLRCFYVRKQIMRQAAGAQHINIGQESLAKISVVLANDDEQETIADFLMKFNKIIELKEKLLAEKQRQKKYLMQQLLTGKKRLPGFDGEWKKVSIGSFINEIDERTTENNQYEILSVTKNGIVRQADHFNKQIASEDNTGYKILRRGNLAFSSMNLWMGSVDVLEDHEIGIISPAYKVFSFNDELMDIKFGRQFMRSEPMIWQYKNNSEQGASIVRRNLDLKALLNTKVRIPEVDEQKAIATVLQDADKEIELLRQSIEQEKQKKKALMQLLLTGIVRV